MPKVRCTCFGIEDAPFGGNCGPLESPGKAQHLWRGNFLATGAPHLGLEGVVSFRDTSPAARVIGSSSRTPETPAVNREAEEGALLGGETPAAARGQKIARR
jgi:hypothetical protein